MRSVRKVALPVPFFSRCSSASSPATPMAAMADTVAAKVSWGRAPQKAPMREVSMQPLPVIRAMVAQPLRSTTVSFPSETMSSTPEMAITVWSCAARVAAISTASPKFSSVMASMALTSTPLPTACWPAKKRISEALPRMAANCTWSNRRLDSSRRS